MRVAIYCRVSTTRQAQQQTIEQQRERLVAHVRAQGWTLREEHIFRDDGYSGSILARPGLDHLRDAARNRELDRVIVTAPDRLARNYVQQMVLLEEFARGGCAVDFLDRPMSDDPHDQLLLQIRGAVAEYERTLIAERMRRGRLSKLRAGLLLPWTRPPYGYRLDPERPRDPSGVMLAPDEAAVVAELFALYLEPGASLARLAQTLQWRGIPTPSGNRRWSGPTIRGILGNPTYTGQVYAQRTRYRAPQVRRSATHAIGRPHGSATPQPPDTWIAVGAVPAIVAQARFDQVQAKLAQNRAFSARNNTAHQYLLRALVSCGRCLLACTARTLNGRHHYYLCNGKHRNGSARCDPPCPSRYIPATQLDELVWADLCALVRDPEHIHAALARAQGGAWLPQELQSRREHLRQGRASVRQQLDRLTDAYLRGVIPLDEYERRRRMLEQQEQGLANQEGQLDGEADRQRELAGVAQSLTDFCRRIEQGLAAATFEQRRQVLLLLVDRVIVTDDAVEIRYVLPTTPGSEPIRFCHLRKDYFHDPPPTTQSALVLDAFAGDPHLNPAPMEGAATVARVVALVGVDLLRALARSSTWSPHRRDGVDDRREDGRVGALGPGQPGGQRQPLAIDGQVTFGPRLAPVGRVRSHRFAPFLARRLALSTDTRDQSSAPSWPSWSRIARCKAYQTPAACQSRRRRQQVLPLPQPSARGSAFQPQPVCSTNMIPHNARRSGSHGRPPLRCGGRGGSSGAISAHKSSGTSVSLSICRERFSPSAGYARSSK
jgi:site-specific DNA recombinase